MAAVSGGRADVRPARRPARGGAARGRVPAGLLLASGAQRRADAGADLPVAVGDGGVLRSGRLWHYALGGRRARPGVRDEVHRRHRAAAAAGGGRPCSSSSRATAGGALGGLALAGVVARRGVLRREPVRVHRLTRVPRRARSTSRRLPTSAGQARPDAAQRAALLPVDVHLGAGLGARAGRRSAAWSRSPSATGARFAVLAPAPVLFLALHGHAGRASSGAG